jgi:hypothetical protein
MPPIKISARNELIQQVRLSLGEPKVRVELTPEQFDLSLTIALERYRYKSSNAVMEKFAFLELQTEKTIYQMPENVIEVRSILRRGTSGTISGGGSQLDPFALAYTNQYLLQSGREGGLLTFELFAGFQELIGRMFGAYITFQYDRNSHELRIDRHIRAPESALIWLYEMKTDETLIRDHNARNWLRDYTIAKCKELLGEIRGKWSNFAVPGGASMNGDALKQEAQATMERLELEVSTQMDQDIGMPFLIG